MIRKERLLDEFLKMVRIASPSRQEARFALFLKNRMEEMGLEVLVDDRAGVSAGCDTGNLVARLKGNREGVEPVLFGAHMDTVSPGENIEPIIREGTVFSSGDTILGADDKSGIAAVLEAIRHIKEEGIPHGDIELLFTVGEETGLLGARYLTRDLLQARRGYVLDSGGKPGTIINQGPAQDKIRAVIHGKAAHAGVNPEEGVSAVQAAARAVDRMVLLRIDQETTANIGVISGGRATNIVCDRVEIEGEARSLSVIKLERQTRHMVDCLQEACLHFGARLEVETERMYPAFHIKEEDPLIQLAKRAGKRTGLETRVVFSGGGSDINFFNERGLKTVNLATGMNRVHTTEEEISIKDLVDTARFVAVIIEEAAALPD
ncbi:MAG: M20/M25/M40 family metallo-hydrolase [Peptococcaceae bacterium]|nr:M20/M25/M40 family metallo-hydrolase [Peptococcaceae bacterium]MDH7523992.1 M20/M25/M40 family metallo-hydrolase [Peptococcaceae bacterium]